MKKKLFFIFSLSFFSVHQASAMEKEKVALCAGEKATEFIFSPTNSYTAQLKPCMRDELRGCTSAKEDVDSYKRYISLYEDSDMGLYLFRNIINEYEYKALSISFENNEAISHFTITADWCSCCDIVSSMKKTVIRYCDFTNNGHAEEVFIWKNPVNPHIVFDSHKVKTIKLSTYGLFHLLKETFFSYKLSKLTL